MKFEYFNFAKIIPPGIRRYSKWEEIIVPVIRWGIVVLLAFTCIKFNINEKIIFLSISYKVIITILVGLVWGVSLKIFESFFKDFLVKRRNKKKGYHICKSCNGNGWTPKSSRHWFFRIHKRPYRGICMICNGRGYVDWIENVVGGKGYNNVDAGPTSSGGSTSSV